MKILSIVNFTTKLLSIKDYFKWTPIERSLRSLLRSFIVKLLIIDNIFIERLGLTPFTVLIITPQTAIYLFNNHMIYKVNNFVIFK